MYISDKRNTTHENPQAGPARSDDHDDDRLLYRRISPYIPARLIPGWNKNFFLNVVDAPYIQERLVVRKLRYSKIHCLPSTNIIMFTETLRVNIIVSINIELKKQRTHIVADGFMHFPAVKFSN